MARVASSEVGNGPPVIDPGVSEMPHVAEPPEGDKRPVGRPRKVEIPVIQPPKGVSAKVDKTYWVQVTDKEGPTKLVDLFLWWRENDVRYPVRIEAHAYRLYPHTIKTGTRSIDKFLDFPPDLREEDPLDYEAIRHWVLNRWGSGNYKVVFADKAPYGAKLATLMLNGVWDDDYLPVVDLDEVDVSNTGNRGYIQKLRLKRVPVPASWRNLQGVGGPMTIENDAPAQSSSAAATQGEPAYSNPMYRTFDRLVEHTLEQKRDGEGKEEKLSQVWQNTTNLAVGMVSDAARRANELAVKGESPEERIKWLLETARAMQPAPDRSLEVVLPIMKELMHSNQQLQTRIAEQSSERLAALEARLANPDGAGGGLMPQLKALAEFKDLLKDLTGSGGGEEGEGGSVGSSGSKEPWWAKYMPIMSQMANGLVAAVGQYSNAMIRKAEIEAGGRTGNPAPPQEQVGQPAGSPPPTPQQEEAAMFAQFISSIQAPLLRCMDDPEKDGVSFAIWLIDGYGKRTYSQLAAAGKEALLGVIQQHGPALFQALTVPSTTQEGARLLTEAASKFFDQFLDAAAVEKALTEDEEEEGPEDESLPVAEAIPIPDPPKRVSRRKEVH